METCCRSFTSHLSRNLDMMSCIPAFSGWCCFRSLSFNVHYLFWKRSRGRRFQNRYNNETSLAIQDRHLVMRNKDERRESLTTSWTSERRGSRWNPWSGLRIFKLRSRCNVRETHKFRGKTEQPTYGKHEFFAGSICVLGLHHLKRLLLRMINYRRRVLLHNELILLTISDADPKTS